jgi:hypothetical protein
MKIMEFTRGFLFGCLVALLFASCAGASSLALTMDGSQRIGERAGVLFVVTANTTLNETYETTCLLWVAETASPSNVVHEYHYSPGNPASYALLTDAGGRAAFTMKIDDAYTAYGDYTAFASCDGATASAAFSVVPADSTIGLANWYLMALQNAPLAIFAVILILGLLFLLGYFGFR